MLPLSAAPLWVLALLVNLALGCFAVVVVPVEITAERPLARLALRVGFVALLACAGILYLIGLGIGLVLERRGHYYPPVPRGRR